MSPKASDWFLFLVLLQDPGLSFRRSWALECWHLVCIVCIVCIDTPMRVRSGSLFSSSRIIGSATIITHVCMHAVHLDTTLPVGSGWAPASCVASKDTRHVIARIRSATDVGCQDTGSRSAKTSNECSLLIFSAFIFWWLVRDAEHMPPGWHIVKANHDFSVLHLCLFSVCWDFLHSHSSRRSSCIFAIDTKLHIFWPVLFHSHLLSMFWRLFSITHNFCQCVDALFQSITTVCHSFDSSFQSPSTSVNASTRRSCQIYHLHALWHIIHCTLISHCRIRCQTLNQA